MFLGESHLRFRRDDREVSHVDENVAVIKEPARQPGHTINLRAMPCGGNTGLKGQALAGAKSRGPHTAEVRATFAVKNIGRKNGLTIGYTLCVHAREYDGRLCVALILHKETTVCHPSNLLDASFSGQPGFRLQVD